MPSYMAYGVIPKLSAAVVAIIMPLLQQTILWNLKPMAQLFRGLVKVPGAAEIYLLKGKPLFLQRKGNGIQKVKLYF